MTKQIEKIILGFLWCQGEMKAGKAKVSWEVVCRAKVESGLGIQSLVSWNKALMTTHIWNVHAQKESLWVIWIHCYRLNKFNFWEIGIKNDLSFAWRKILQLRSLIRPFIRYKIGNDKSRSWGLILGKIMVRLELLCQTEILLELLSRWFQMSRILWMV